MGDVATAEGTALLQQMALMAAGLQRKSDWKGFAVAAFNSAAGTGVNAGLGEAR